MRKAKHFTVLCSNANRWLRAKPSKLPLYQGNSIIHSKPLQPADRLPASMLRDILQAPTRFRNCLLRVARKHTQQVRKSQKVSQMAFVTVLFALVLHPCATVTVQVQLVVDPCIFRDCSMMQSNTSSSSRRAVSDSIKDVKTLRRPRSCANPRRY